MRFQDLIDSYPREWHAATQHAFLDGARDGTLAVAALERWLSQDYLFVQTSIKAQALLFARAPRADQALLIGGLAALEAELTWFETNLRARRLDLNAPLAPTNRAYGDFLLVTASGPYPAGIVAVTALERAYLEAWSGALPGAEPFREFVGRWTTDEFRAYVSELEEAADRAVASATDEERREAEAAFLWTAAYERDFWQMAFG